MKKHSILLGLLLVSASTFAADRSITPADTEQYADTCIANNDHSGSNQMCAVDQARTTYCCRVCTVGKACGNSCISQDKQCHQPVGCACDSN